MPYSLEEKLVVAISSRALFDLDEANRVYEERGLKEYRKYQIENENVPLSKGTGFPLVKALLGVNVDPNDPIVEVIIVSRNDADSSLRIWNSVEHHGLSISRGGFVGGADPFPYLAPFHTKLFLSAHPNDVREALSLGHAAARVYDPPDSFRTDEKQVRIAFDGDAVLFSGAAERIYQTQGLAQFQQHEIDFADVPIEPGPFKGFLAAIAAIQQRFDESECPIRTALVTARNAPAHKRAIKTLRHWNIRVNESFFLGGVEKTGILQVFKPQIFFDDQAAHLDRCANTIPSAEVICPEATGQAGKPLKIPSDHARHDPRRRTLGAAKSPRKKSGSG